MTSHEMKKFMAHCEKYLEQPVDVVLHPSKSDDLHIDVLRFAPTEKYPFWKLITMGASDYKMPKLKASLGDRNEYIFFVDPMEDLTEQTNLQWYCLLLTGIAKYPRSTKTPVTYAHSIEWGDAEEGWDMAGVFFEFPQMIESTDFLRCKLGMFKSVVCLQAITLTRRELDHLLRIGPQAFSDFLYPDDDDSRPHFISQKTRTERF